MDEPPESWRWQFEERGERLEAYKLVSDLTMDTIIDIAKTRD